MHGARALEDFTMLYFGLIDLFLSRPELYLSMKSKEEKYEQVNEEIGKFSPPPPTTTTTKSVVARFFGHSGILCIGVLFSFSQR